MAQTSNLQNFSPWTTGSVESDSLCDFGFKLSGGGTHQSKTMMLSEIEALIPYINETNLKELIIEFNILSKDTLSARRLTFRHLNTLYGLSDTSPISNAFKALIRQDRQGLALHCLLMAIARDPLLRDSASTITSAFPGDPVQWPVIAKSLESQHPSRFTVKMVKSLSQNCASTWTQSGHLEGAYRKIRRRVTPTAANVAFATLLATVCGFGGPALLGSPWLQILDLSTDRALDMLRQAEAQGMARVRSAGEVIEISVRQPLQKTLGVCGLV